MIIILLKCTSVILQPSLHQGSVKMLSEQIHVLAFDPNAVAKKICSPFLSFILYDDDLQPVI